MINSILESIENCVDAYYKQRLKIIQSHIGNKILDALFFMPNSVIEKQEINDITPEMVNKIIIANVFIQAIENSNSKSRPIKIYGKIGSTTIEILFFNSNQKFIFSIFKIGQYVKIVGKLTLSNYYQIINPQRANLRTKSGLYNVYSLKAGITQELIYSIERNAVRILNNANLQEWLPPDILEKYKFKSFYESVYAIHNPRIKSLSLQDNIYKARLCFDELLAEQLTIQSNKEVLEGISCNNSKKLIQEFIEKLPFELTDSQIQASNEIFADMSKPVAMRRLLQGDVGSGKTIVAILAMLYAIESGVQCAMLVPTDILARQHIKTISTYLKDINVDILTAYEKGKVRKKILDNIKFGITKIIVGTHALFNDNLEFDNLGLVVIDEQHRFGVGQRLKLIQKSKNPHILSMTATPIPRTIIMSMHGDIDVSSIVNKPKGRKEVITTSCNDITKIVEAIKRLLSKNQKVYWICPLIKESEKLDYAYVIKRYEYLKQHFGNEVGMLHGKMKNADKQIAFDNFYNGNTKILVSTTVIEVGVDDPNATAIIIENAERFGLAQLHQLRGRVGRSNLQSYCILLCSTAMSCITKKRIEIMKSTNDGFVIAEEDLRLRGGGEIHGTKQSGQKQYKTFSINAPHEQDLVNEYMLTANKLAKDIVKYNYINKYRDLLYIFKSDFNITKSF